MYTKQEIYNLETKEIDKEIDITEKEIAKYEISLHTATKRETHMVNNLKTYLAQLHTIKREKISIKK